MTTTSQPSGKRLTLAVIGLGILTFVCSFLLGIGRSIWFDEGYTTVILNKSSMSEMLALASVDAHPPLYYILLRGWCAVFGHNILAMRALSAVFCGLTMIVMALLIKELLGTRYMTLSLPFLVAAPLLLRYGYEIRMYALMSLISVAGTYVLIRALKASGRARIGWWVVYAVLVAAGMYTQYVMAFVWLAHALWLFVGTIGNLLKAKRETTDETLQPKRRWYSFMMEYGPHSWGWLIAYIAAVVLYIPWIPFAVGQMQHSALPWTTTSLNVTMFGRLFTTLLTGIDGDRLGAALTLIIALVVVMWVLAALRRHDTWRSRGEFATHERSAIWMMVYLFVLPLLVFLMIGVTEEVFGSHPFFTFRYICGCAPYGYMLIALLCAATVLDRDPDPAGRIPAKGQRWGVWIVSLLVLIGGCVSYVFQGNYIYEQGRTPQVNVTADAVQCSADSPIVAADEATYISLYYYYRDCSNFYFLKDGEVDTRGGYAPLRGTAAQIRSLDELKGKGAQTVRFLGDDEASVKTNSFQKESSKTVGDYTLTTFSAK